ncbi:hypothetical protein HRbin12_01365 [bacterium HR12]|nr:hypothetical protein HRbin12_01365 [bacterium HR12]
MIRLGEPLGLEDVVAVARGEAVELAPAAAERMRGARRVVEDAVARGFKGCRCKCARGYSISKACPCNGVHRWC